MFKPQQTGEKKTTEEEVEDYMRDTNTEEEIKNALGLLVSTYFVRNVPEEYDTPDYTVDDQIVNEIYDQIKGIEISHLAIANLINMYCGKYIKENY
jgi:hypothetical protein